jgi:predicted PolB exonuclease-like 3'-5' exonuclease
MITHPLLAFDIETIPDPDVGRRLWGLEADDFEVVRQMVERRLEETEGQTGYPQLPHHRVVTIGVGALDPETGSFQVTTVGGRALDERSHLEGFFRFLRETPRPARLISWNGNGFDLPVIRYRSMMHGIAAPEFYRTDGDWKWNNYQNRYHEMHVDLMDALSGYGASHWVGLGTMSELLGLPGKSFLEEGEVWENLARGKEELVREYCKLDVGSTILIYLDWEFHRGNLTEDELRQHVATIRGELEKERFEGWQEVAEGLQDWPQWGEESP